MDDIGVRLERHLDLAQVVVRVGVLESEADEPLDNGAQPALVLCGDSGRGRKRSQAGRHERPRARVAQDSELHPGHGDNPSETRLGPGTSGGVFPGVAATAAVWRISVSFADTQSTDIALRFICFRLR